MTLKTKGKSRLRRRRRVRAKVRGTAERPRLSVFRSNKGVQAQLIDDVAGNTLAAVNWTEKELKELGRMEQATRAGALLAERAVHLDAPRRDRDRDAGRDFDWTLSDSAHSATRRNR